MTATKEKQKPVKKVKKTTPEPVEEKVTREALDGVEYDLITGARCPRCEMYLKKLPGKTTTNVLPWEDGVRVRYHDCRRCGARFKSIETKPQK